MDGGDIMVESIKAPRDCRYKLLLGTTLCAGALMLPIAACAQEQIEEIVVTAQKRQQDISRVGITMQAFTADKLQSAGVRTAQDLQAITPGLTVTEAAPTGVPVYTIRGVGFADYATASSSTVGLYADEVAIPYPVMSRGLMFDIQRAEVLKGPQGDLYGRNATAGQVNFISNKPTKVLEAGMTVGFSRFNVLDAEGYVSGPVADKVQARLAAKVVESGKGWQRSISRPGDTLGKQDKIAVRGQVNVDLADNASLLINLHLVKDRSENQAPTAYDGTLVGHIQSQPIPTGMDATPYFSVGDNRLAEWGATARPRTDSTLKGGSVHLKWDVTDGINLTSITAYDRFDRADAYEMDGLPFVSGQSTNANKIKAFSQEVRLASNGDSNFSWILGGYYSHDTIDEDYKIFMEQSYGNILGINQIDNRYSQKTTSKAGFGHVEWKFADALRLTLGSRYTEEKRSFSGCTYDNGDGSLAWGWNNILTPFTILANGFPDPGALLPGGCGQYDDIEGSANFGTFAVFNDSIKTKKWMGKVSADYSPTDDVMIYATVSNGFKSGGFNGAASQTHSQLLPYKPETLTAYEVGLKSKWLNRHLQLNASAFYYNYENKQEPTIAVTPVGNISGLTNVPKSRVLGAEVEMQARPMTGLTVDLGATYVDTKILDYMAISSDSVFPTVVRFDASGLPLANAPKWQANGTVTYEWALTDALNMMVASDVSYKSSTEGTQDLVSNYVLVNGRVGVSAADGRWSATLWARNIFNRYYWTAAFSGNGSYVRLNGMPATYGVTVSHKF
jgi:iron complex outermembrane receptor protein